MRPLNTTNINDQFMAIAKDPSILDSILATGDAEEISEVIQFLVSAAIQLQKEDACLGMLILTKRFYLIPIIYII